MYKIGKKSIALAILISLVIGVLQFNTHIKADSSKLNMSYVYFGNKSIYTSLVENTKGSLQVISPSYFDLEIDGNLKITGTLDETFIEDMHERGVKVTPFLSNHWNREKGRKALENKDQLTDQVVEAINKYNLDGVNIDIENVNEKDREDYVDFVKTLRNKLPKEKVISVAVAANPLDLDIGWQGSYDYKALSEYSDYLVIMAYDESWEGSNPGAVASISFVEDAIKYALEKDVPKEKIVLAIPFYGRIWNNDKSTWHYENNWNGDGLSLKKVEELKKRYDVEATYDVNNQAPYLTINIDEENESILYYKRELYAGTYTVWHENEASIKAKLRLINKYDLRGAASWSLGQELPSTWDYFDLWLNGKYFTDTENHWAFDYILSVQNKGWMIGTSSTEFSPDNVLTRAQAATTLVRALGLESSEYNSNFTDIDDGHWAKEYIDIANQYGLFIGDGSGKFLPEKILSREEMATVIDRILYEDDDLIDTFPFEKTFEDINSKDWSYKSIVRLTNNGILNGYPNGIFDPKGNITRAQMATVMNNVSFSDSYILTMK